MRRPLEEKRFRIADLTVDLDEWSVVREPGGPVELPRLSFDLLVALARRAPAVVPAEELIATVWGGLAVADETLTQRVALLRRALGDQAKNPRYLRAVRGRGYQLVPPVVVEPEASADTGRPANPPPGNPEDLPTAEPLPPTRRRAGARRGVFLALAAASLGVVVLLLVTFARRDSSPEPRGSRHAAAPQPAPQPAAVDLAAPVATRAATVPELVRRADAYLAQHQEANNELAIELYQRALQLDGQNAPALAGLSLALSQRATKFNRHGGGDQALALAERAVAVDPRLGRAYQALGLARDSRGELRAAIAAYLRAASLAPRPAAALASAANLLQVEGHLAAALETNLRAARDSAGDSPMYLEVQLGGTLAALGFEPAATVWFDRALELRPDNVFAAAAYAAARLSQGRVREADAVAARAIARGIRRPELADVRGTVALLAGDTARARAFFVQALGVSRHDLRAQSRLLVLALAEPGGSLPGGGSAAGPVAAPLAAPGTRAVASPLAAAGPGAVAAAVAGAAADGAAGERRRAVTDLAAELRRGRAAGDEWPDSGLDEALLDTAAGDGGAALAALDAAIALGYRDAGWLELDPMLAPLRRDGRFGERLARIRRLVEGERQGVLAAPWLPPGLLAGSAARM